MTEYLVKRGGKAESVHILRDDGQRAVVQVGDTTLELEIRTLPDGRTALIHGKERHLLRTFQERETTVIVQGSVQHRFEVEDARESWLHAAGGAKGAAGGRIVASMPGRVVRVPVAVGDVVAPGTVVAVLEAMKMENDVKSPGGGKVVAIAVSEGAAVEAGALLVQLEAS
jgi:3-methylcrotonyl-CoA carboxylase alpha subunit